MTSTAPSASTREPRARQVVAAVAAAGLLGASIVVPLSFSSALAADGTSAAAAAEPLSGQALETAALPDPTLHLAAVEAADVQPVSLPAPAPAAQFSLGDLLFRGVIHWSGYKFTFYSEQVLPGNGLDIPGRHVNAGGYVSDADGYIVLAGSAPKGTVYETPFGYPGKIYDRGTVGVHLDVYIR